MTCLSTRLQNRHQNSGTTILMALGYLDSAETVSAPREWVKTGKARPSKCRPLFTQYWTQVGHRVMSEKCQQATSRLRRVV